MQLDFTWGWEAAAGPPGSLGSFCWGKFSGSVYTPPELESLRRDERNIWTQSHPRKISRWRWNLCAHFALGEVEGAAQPVSW